MKLINWSSKSLIMITIVLSLAAVAQAATPQAIIDLCNRSAEFRNDLNEYRRLNAERDTELTGMFEAGWVSPPTQGPYDKWSKMNTLVERWPQIIQADNLNTMSCSDYGY